MKSLSTWSVAGVALLGAIGCLWFVALGPRSTAEGRAMSESPFPQRLRVPPLPEGVAWLNTAGPLELNDLRGKFVLLDFWTYCCINCMHVLPELEKLEKEYPRNLVVIGVHSAKFETEKDSKNIAEAILRYKIEHPVINDSEHVVWDRFGVRAWPTLMLIDPEGYVVWGTSGETTFEELDPILKKGLPYYRKKGLLDETPLRFDLEADRAPKTPLRFPGKVLADEPVDRLFIADSSHNRIVVTRLDGTLVDVIGCGAVGRNDGSFDTASFNDPQGMAIRGETLYVADNRNHIIRRVDLAGRTVTTIAGIGQQGRRAMVSRAGNPRRTALASPWALWIHEDDLYIAMAGPHQIWRMRLDGSAIGPYAGNGREDIVDGPLLPREPYQAGYASFAQPSGLASDGTRLFVADSEGSSIRAVPFDPRGKVSTVVGTANLPAARLFTFGDADGPRDRVLLQHALGVVYYEGRLYVADTYNNKIKLVDPESGTTETLAGSGTPGNSDAVPTFDEPAGVTAAAGKLFVADTNNHLIRMVDLGGGNKVSTLSIPGLQPPRPRAKTKPSFNFPGAAEEKLDRVSVRAEDGAVRLQVKLELPFGYKINTAAPMAYQVEAPAANDGVAAGPVRRDSLGQPIPVEKPAAEFDVSLPVDAATGRDTVRLGLTYYYCREGAEGLCKAGSVVWTVPLELSPEAGTAVVTLRHRVR